MQNERWDIELDLVYEINRRVDRFTVTLPPCPSGNPDADCNMGRWEAQADTGLYQGIPPSLALEHRLRDQLSLRLGGDYNFVPGVAAARLGFSYETMGVEHGFQQLDFMPFQRFGLHAGFTVRLADRFDISLSYAHIFQSEQVVSEDDAQLHQTNAESRIGELTCLEGAADPDDCGRPQAQGTFGEGTVINAGRFTSHFDILSLGLTYHFR